MAKDKDPRFHHPPLEVGIPQYPTPLVPNYGNKQGGWNIDDEGHIVLVEKISVEKGSFSPLPLDGSITYQGRDAAKWPSTLYLVAERPTDDGEYCYRYWANDRSITSQNLWNYGVTYSSENTAYPIYTRSYIVPRSQYTSVSSGSTDPVFGGTAIITKQEMAELPEDNPLRSRYVAVKVVYESIPGPLLTAQKYDERGDLETITIQTVAAGTPANSDGINVSESSVQPIDSVKSTSTYATVTSRSTLNTNQNKPGLLGTTKTSDDIVSPTTPPDALTAPDGLGKSVIDSTVEAISTTKSRKKTTISSGPNFLSGQQTKSGLLGSTNVVETIVAYGSQADAITSPLTGTGVLESTVTPIDAFKSKKTTTTSQGPTSLSGDEQKPGLLGITNTTESIVAAGSSPDALSTTQGVISSTVTPIDSVKSKKTTVKSTSPLSLSGAETKSGLLGTTSVTESIVDAGSSADALTSPLTGTGVLSSVVTPIDSVRSKKTTITSTSPTSLNGDKNVSGILGETSVVESIVAAGAQADDLNATILSSEVTPIDAVKSKKTTVTLTGPQSLTAYEKKPGLQGESYTVEKIVTAGTQADSLSTTVLSSSITPIDKGKSRLTTTTSQGPTSLSGYGKKTGLLGETLTTESIVAAGSQADSLSTTVISSDVTPIDSAKSRKVTVTSQGPTSLNGDSNKPGLFGETSIVESIVAAGSQADDLDTTIISSEVTPIDSAKSKKTTVQYTGPQSLAGYGKKSGLLGETLTTESIVAAGAQADSLSLSVISSDITPVDKAKSRKVTITSQGPTSLSAYGKKSGLLGETLTTESIVAAGSQADALSTSVISSEITPIDSAKSKKVTITSQGPTSLTGYEKKPGLQGETYTVESIVTAGTQADALSTTILSSFITPIDSAKSKKTTTTSQGPTELDSQALHEFGVADIVETIQPQSNTLPTPTVNTISSEIRQLDNAKSKQTVISYSSPQTLTSHEYDPSVDITIVTTKSIVTPSTVLGYQSINGNPSDNSIISDRIESVNPYQSVRIQSKIDKLPDTKTLYKTGQYSSPALLFGISGSSVKGTDGSVYSQISPNIQSRKNYTTTFKHVTSYSYGSPTLPDLSTVLNPVPVPVYYDGMWFSVNVGDCLTDSTGSISGPGYSTKVSITISGGDPWTATTENYIIPLTNIGASQYLAYRNTWQLVSFDLDYWKANIYVLNTTYVYVL
jgi:hypothetical protein